MDPSNLPTGYQFIFATYEAQTHFACLNYANYGASYPSLFIRQSPTAALTKLKGYPGSNFHSDLVTYSGVDRNANLVTGFASPNSACDADQNIFRAGQALLWPANGMSFEIMDSVANIVVDTNCFHCYNAFQQMLKRRKTMKEKDVILSAQTVLRSCLEQVPFLEIRAMQLSDLDIGLNIILEVRIDDKDRDLIVAVKNNGQPRIARLVTYQLKDVISQKPNAYGIFLAPYISSEAGKICEENGIGYLDLAGNCLISFDTVYIRQNGAKNLDVPRREYRSLYSPKGERILRVLLDQPKRTWKTAELAQAADVSLGQVANIKKLLLDREWLRDFMNGIALSNPSALIDEWSQSYNFQRNKAIECYALAEIAEIEAQVAETCRNLDIRYALTGFSSAARIAPMVRYQKASIYIDGDISSVINTLGWKAVSSGSNVSLLIPYDEGIFLGNSEIDSMMIVSPVQTYLDLQSGHGRGQEAAEAVRVVMEKTWS